MLERTKGVPLYRRLAVILEDRIRSGRLAVGERTPSEAELCAEFGVSRITAQRALNELSDAGLVERARGRGTRVVGTGGPGPMAAPLEGLFENVRHMGRTTRVEVLDHRYLAATPEVAERLEIAPGAPVHRAVRVRRLGEVPMSYLVTVVPERIGRLVEGEDFSETPLLLLLEAAGVAVSSAEQTVSATLADPEVAAVLDVSPGAPLIDVERLVRDEADRPVESIRVLYRPDLYRVRTSMRRTGADAARRWRMAE